MITNEKKIPPSLLIQSSTLTIFRILMINFLLPKHLDIGLAKYNANTMTLNAWLADTAKHGYNTCI